MAGLFIPKTIVDAMVAHAKTVAPEEACGILAGRDSQVETIHPMTNVDHSREHFMMKPEEQFAVVRKIREAGHEMLAIYHSHPASPARPSPEDIRLALTPGVTYVIVSLLSEGRPVVKGFKIEDDAVTKVPIYRRKHPALAAREEQ